MTIEEAAVGALAHGVQAQCHRLQHLCGIQRPIGRVISLQFFQNQVMQIRQNRVILRRQLLEIGFLCDAKPFIQLLEDDFNGVDLRIGEGLVASEEITQKRDMLAENGFLPERIGCGGIAVPGFGPAAGLEDVDSISAAHQIQIASAKRIGQFLIFRFRVQDKDGFAGFQKARQEQLEQIAFSFAAVAQNDHAGIGFVLTAPVEIHDHRAAVFVLADVETIGIGLAGIRKGIQVCHTAGRQYALELFPEHIVSAGHDAEKTFPLTQQQLIHGNFRGVERRFHLCLQLPQPIHVRCAQFQKYGRMEERFLVPVCLGDQRGHILQIVLGLHHILKLLSIGPAQLVDFLGIG